MSDEIRLEQSGSIGLVTLDRPTALNALTHPMVRELSRALVEWRQDPAISAVVIRAVPGRAFCAGGDIRVVSDLVARQGAAAVLPFFADEYRMNWRIKRFPKPYIALMDGITMGGGVGVSVHGSHRIVTERTMFAMPETGIGMFPDVGGTWFLPRLPGEVGTYLGLTGHRLGGADCLSVGIGTHFVPSEHIENLVDRVCSGMAIEDVLGELATTPGEAPLLARRSEIDAHLSANDIPSLLSRLEGSETAFAGECLASLRGKSPISVGIALRQIREGAGLEFEECMRLEYRLVGHVMAHGDFQEGVRALIIDKDKQPRWQDAALEDVSADHVERFFVPRENDRLELDWRDR